VLAVRNLAKHSCSRGVDALNDHFHSQPILVNRGTIDIVQIARATAREW
jgi:hypothetical protein